jgi:membrane associated rhomboid family serine protease
VTYRTNPRPDAPPPDPYLPLPVSKPFLTYIVLGIIAVVWLLMELLGGSTNTAVLLAFGANSGRRILLDGEIWRLFTSMFLHIGIAHLAFNAYALFIFGLEMERLYGPDRFIVVYILAGLFGSLASFAARGPFVLSAGASGAIFGVIGMNLAFFLLHRDTFGRFGRQRMVSTLVIIGINLVFGFTVPGIDNYAHIGGLVAGFALGYGLAPRYQVVNQYSFSPRVVDKISLLNRWWVSALAVVLLSGGVYLSLVFWLTRIGQ